MKTRRITWLVLALLMSAATIYAQGRRNGNGYGRGYGNCYYAGSGNWQSLTCMNVLPGLTEDQENQIQEMEKAHQQTMAELREERRSTFDPIEKNEIRGQMLKKVKNHRDGVRKLLNEEQQQVYDQLHARGNFNRQGFARGRNNGQKTGYNSRGRGNGRGNFTGRGRGANRNCNWNMRGGNWNY